MVDGKVEVYAKFLIDPSLVDEDKLYGEILEKILLESCPDKIKLVDYQVADSSSKLFSERYVNYLSDFYMKADLDDDWLMKNKPMSIVDFAKYETNQKFGCMAKVIVEGEENNG